MKEKIKKQTKIFLLAEAVFVLAILSYVLFFNSPKQIYPISGMSIYEDNFVLEISNGETVLISSEKNFVNPIVLVEGDDITLNPGLYYWKVRGTLLESEVMNFTIESRVGLDIKEKKVSYEIVNSGNVPIKVNTKNDSLGILNESESIVVEKNNLSYEGRQI